MINISAIKSFDKKTVLEILNISLEENKCYALMGANGSGKSTLLKIIDRQLKSDNGARTENVKVGYMPQSSYAFSMSVKRNILLPLKWSERKRYSKKADYLIKELGLEKYGKKNATRLSGGETQRMAFCRALLVPCDLLLLDEPTSAMDVEQARTVINLLKQEKKDRTVIFATHSIKQAEELADEVLFLYNGKLIERGEPSQILRNPKTNEIRDFISYNR